MMSELLEYALIAVFGALFLVLMSKFLMQKLIRRNAFYYENRERKEEREMLAKAGIPEEGEEL